MSQPTPPFPQTVLDALARAGERPVFEHGSRTVTGSETLAMIRAAASGLRALGFETGDAIALLPGVLPEGFAVMLAAFTLGLRVSAVRPGLTPAQFAHLVAEGNDAIVADPQAAPTEVLAAASGTPLHTTDGLVADPDDGVTLVPAGHPDDVARSGAGWIISSYSNSKKRAGPPTPMAQVAGTSSPNYAGSLRGAADRACSDPCSART